MIGSTFTASGELTRLGFRLAGFKGWPLDESIRTLAEMGYQSVELCIEHPDMDPEKLTPDTIARIGEILKDNAIRVSSVGYSGKGDDIIASLAAQKRGLEIAREFDCRTLVVGTVLETADPDGSKTYKALEDLLRAAEETGLIIAVEPEPNTVLNGIYEFSLLASRLAG
jgi:sugar phosphate isomerase/epimerase